MSDSWRDFWTQLEDVAERELKRELARRGWCLSIETKSTVYDPTPRRIYVARCHGTELQGHSPASLLELVDEANRTPGECG